MVDRRVAGLPLEQVIGWAEFCGLRIAVDPEVFVPRLRTEFLVAQALLLLLARGDDPPGPPDHGGAARPPVPPWPGPRKGAGGREIVVDLCCGVGAIGAALAVAGDRVEVDAVDLDPAAVACARRNLEGFTAQVYEGDLYEPLHAALRGRVALVVANVPYVPTGEIDLLPVEAREYEPRIALDGGPDGLDVLRRVAAGAPGWLAPGGYLLIETSERQAPQAVAAFAAAGLVPRMVSSADLNATVVIGTGPAGSGTS